jgi:GT2 family glycosyltransferase
LTTKKAPTTAVVVNTYNWPWALERVLTGLARQSDPDFEVVIADDGSGAPTRELIESFRARAPYRIEHVWQEDVGFRRSLALNRAVTRTRAELLCFIDHDSIPASNWVETFRRMHDPDGFTAGGYCRLTPEESKAIELETVTSGAFEKLMTPERRRHNVFYHWANAWSRLMGRVNRPRLLGLSFAVSRALFEKVNGIDHAYVGWGKEDSDLRTRMRMAGGVGRSAWSRSFVFHLWHPSSPTKEKKAVNQARYDLLRAGGLPWRCENGLAQVAATR